MNIYTHKVCSTNHKHRSRKSCSNKKIGLIMLLLGAVTVLALFLPLQYWVLLLSGALIVFGVIILKK